MGFVFVVGYFFQYFFNIVTVIVVVFAGVVLAHILWQYVNDVLALLISFLSLFLHLLMLHMFCFYFFYSYIIYCIINKNFFLLLLLFGSFLKFAYGWLLLCIDWMCSNLKCKYVYNIMMVCKTPSSFMYINFLNNK